MTKPKEQAMEYLKDNFMFKGDDMSKQEPMKSILGDKVYNESVVIQAIDIVLSAQAKEIFRELEDKLGFVQLGWVEFPEIFIDIKEEVDKLKKRFIK